MHIHTCMHMSTIHTHTHEHTHRHFVTQTPTHTHPYLQYNWELFRRRAALKSVHQPHLKSSELLGKERTVLEVLSVLVQRQLLQAQVQRHVPSLPAHIAVSVTTLGAPGSRMLQLLEHQNNNTATTLTGVQFPSYDEGFSLLCQLEVQILLWCSYSPCVQSPAPTSTPTLNKSHTMAAHKNAAHTGRNGWCCSCG